MGGDIAGVIEGDEAVGVAGIADDEDADIGGGGALDGLALTDEDLAVDVEEVLAFHALFAGDAADEEGPVHAAEGFVHVGSGDDALEEREGAVVEFHDDALEGWEGGFDFEELEDDRLIGAEHGAGGDADEEGVSDLTGSAGDGHANGGFHEVINDCVKPAALARRAGGARGGWKISGGDYFGMGERLMDWRSMTAGPGLERGWTVTDQKPAAGRSTVPMERGTKFWKWPVSLTVNLRGGLGGADLSALSGAKETSTRAPPEPWPQPWTTSTSNVPGVWMENVHEAESVGSVQKPRVFLF